MKEIIPPVDYRLLHAELSEDKLVVKNRNGNSNIYSVDYKNAPNVLKEIGRLREISYRNVKSGTGKDCDIDALDIAEIPYNQLVAWDPGKKEILGGYRYILCNDLNNGNNEFNIGTSRLFEFSNKFKVDYLPKTIELGRSFVRPEYQIGSNVRKGIFVLDSLWEGLGALIGRNPEIEYFFGQVSIFANKNPKTLELILYFLKTYFPDKNNLVVPKKPVNIQHSSDEYKKIFTSNEIKENHKILSQTVRSFNENIPPLINTYINTSPKLVTFGAVQNPNFEGMIDVGILIALKDIYETKKKRYIQVLTT